MFDGEEIKWLKRRTGEEKNANLMACLTYQGLFYAERLGNHNHCTFIFILCSCF